MPLTSRIFSEMWLSSSALIVFVLTFTVTSCTTIAPETRPRQYLSETAQNQFLYDIARYHGKLAPKSDHLTKFDTKFNDEYRQIASQYELIAYYPMPNSDTIFFMTYRIAPSLTIKKVATAGKLVWGNDKKPVFYEEVFRTWKMLPDELDIKAGHLWSKVISREDLTPYLPQNSGEDEYIEFPDEYTRFDTELKRWVSTRENPLEELYQEEKDLKNLE